MSTNDILSRPYSVLLADAIVQKPAKTCLWCAKPFTLGFGVFCSRKCANDEVAS
jgi:hypothetical protein